MKNNVLLQIFFWLILAGISFGFTLNIMPTQPAIYAAILHLSFYGLSVYFNILYIFPRFYDSANSWKFIMLNFLLVSLVSFLLAITEKFLFAKYVSAPHHIDHPEIFMFMRNFFWLILTNTITSGYMIQERLSKHEAFNKKVMEEKLNTELKLLKAQINPHFLFNALNNIYSLTYMKSDRAPESVLQLSGMLRYVIEDCTQETVLLKSEIEYIENYISFQKMKSPDELRIDFNYDDANQQLRVSPLLMIPFIENSFKYSKIEDFEDAFIRMNIKTTGKNEVEFTILNSIPAQSRVGSGTGTGINNVKQRLQISYPEKHKLTIRELEQSYEVHLKLSI